MTAVEGHPQSAPHGQLIIATGSLRLFAGSEIVCKDLALAAKSLGWEPLLYASDAGEPFTGVLDAEGIPWTTDENDARIGDVRAIWSHHSNTPPALIRRLVEDPSIRYVCSHLGPWHPREAPRALGFEMERADIILAVSNETKSALMDAYSIPEDRIEIFPNSASRATWRRGDSATPAATAAGARVAVVSNHLPPELRDAMQALPDAIDVVFFGLNDRFSLLTDDDLSGFDRVVTCGRTVFQAAALGIPAFVYDHFGGPGWITPNNVEKVFAHNCSGRPYSTRPAADLTGEFLAGFEDALREFSAVRTVFASCVTEDLAASVLDGSVRSSARNRGSRLSPAARVAMAISEEQNALLRTQGAAYSWHIDEQKRREELAETSRRLVESEETVRRLRERVATLERFEQEVAAFRSRRIIKLVDGTASLARRILP